MRAFFAEMATTAFKYLFKRPERSYEVELYLLRKTRRAHAFA
jgi:hypothetical protein